MGLCVANVVIDVPASAYAALAGRVAAMYGALLGFDVLSRGDWYRAAGWPADEGDDVDPLVRSNDPTQPSFAFEPVHGAFAPPRWPDPAHPQHLHLDLVVADLDQATEVASGHGARILVERDGRRVLADAVGHPFCLVPGGGPGPGRVSRIVLDGPDPAALAAFWSGLLGPSTRPGAPTLACQHAGGPRPAWPDPRRPQQVHLDLGSDDPAASEEDSHARALSLGATALPYLGGGFVFADPAGHPFCLSE